MDLCKICSEAGDSCCANYDYLVTNGDVQRISAYTGRNDFYENRYPQLEDYLRFDPADPNWLTYTLNADKTRKVLKNKTDNSCGFLGATGCSLPMSVRPLVCRLHPFDFTEKEVKATSPYCLISEAPNKFAIFESAGMGLHQIEQWRVQLYEELRQQTLEKELTEKHGQEVRKHENA